MKAKELDTDGVVRLFSAIYPDEMKKVFPEEVCKNCPWCGLESDNFSTKQKVSRKCSACIALTPILTKHALAYGEYVKILTGQQYKCAICNDKLVQGRQQHIDHCHKHGHVRGILCGSCNRGLGCFRENALRLLSAARYVLHNELFRTWWFQRFL